MGTGSEGLNSVHPGDYELFVLFLSEEYFSIKCLLVVTCSFFASVSSKEWRIIHSFGRTSVQGSLVLGRLKGDHFPLYVPFQ